MSRVRRLGRCPQTATLVKLCVMCIIVIHYIEYMPVKMSEGLAFVHVHHFCLYEVLFSICLVMLIVPEASALVVIGDYRRINIST